MHAITWIICIIITIFIVQSFFARDNFVASGNSVGCDVPEGTTCYIRNRDIGLPARGFPLPGFEQDFIGAITTYRLTVDDARKMRSDTFLETQALNMMRLK